MADKINPTAFHKFLSYPRAIVGGVILIAYILVGGILMVVSGSPDFQDRIFHVWGDLTMWLFNIKLKVVGTENLTSHGALFIFNHASLFDIPVFYAAVRKRARYGAKIELFKIPIFSAAMRATGTLPIARGERDKVLKLYDDSINRVTEGGESFILAGEGTRQPTAGVGKSFKSGPFIFAISGQFPIQPLVINGAAEVLPKKHLFPGWGRWVNPITVTILPEVSTKGVSLEDRDQLKQKVRDSMEKAYHESETEK